MRFVTTDEGLVYPERSLTGRADGELLDTEWDWDQGPGRLYLHPRDIVDVLVESRHLPLVREALELEGWTPPGQVAAESAALMDDLAEVMAERNELAVKVEALSATVMHLGTSEPVFAAVGGPNEGNA